jgi:hypothetical protein
MLPSNDDVPLGANCRPLELDPYKAVDDSIVVVKSDESIVDQD